MSASRIIDVSDRKSEIVSILDGMLTAIKNCGTGDGGFRAGNQCARTGMSLAMNLQKDPLSFRLKSYDVLVDQKLAKKSLLSKKPKDGEFLALVNRPQTKHGFVVYAKGDYISGHTEQLTAGGNSKWVVTSAGKPYQKGDENSLRWQQYITVRKATDADRDAVAPQIAAQEVERARIMDWGMNS